MNFYNIVENRSFMNKVVFFGYQEEYLVALQKNFLFYTHQS